MIELMVVLGIVGLLVALLVPAVMTARESVRRTQCLSNLKQIGLAIHNYQSAHGCFPIGRLTCFSDLIAFRETFIPGGQTLDPKARSSETSWVMSLLPYLESGQLAEQFNSDLGAFCRISSNPPYYVEGVNANHTVFQRRLSMFVCPSDRHSEFSFDPKRILGQAGGPPVPLARGNYGCNWGNTNWAQSNDLDFDGWPDVRLLPAPFGCSAVTPGMISKGLAQTVFVGELRQGMDLDLRGVLYYPAPGACVLLSRHTPNGDRDVYRSGPTRDLLPYGPLCKDEGSLPCFSTIEIETTFAAARSNHARGVHVLMGDGATDFVSNAIDSDVWLSLHCREATPSP